MKACRRTSNKCAPFVESNCCVTVLKSIMHVIKIFSKAHPKLHACQRGRIGSLQCLYTVCIQDFTE